MAISFSLHLPKLSLPKSLFVALLLIISSLASIFLTPNLKSNSTTPDFEKIIPKQFGDWKAVPDPYAQVSLTANKNDQINILYDQVLMRTYQNAQGEQIMLALAYAKEQKQDIKIHRPEVCYVAQGFQLVRQAKHSINLSSSPIPVLAQQLIMSVQSRFEAVTYWIRIGNEYPSNGYAARWEILREGIKGNVLDGILVRASTALADETTVNAAYDKQDQFLNALVGALKSNDTKILVAE